MRFIALCLFFCISTVVHAADIAIVVRTQGEVIKTDKMNVVSPLKRKDTLIEGDKIKTGKNAYITLKFSDQSIVDLGPNSDLSLTRYRPSEPMGQKKVLLELVSGQFRTITGDLAKNPTAFDLRTAQASIGVRGTEFEVLIVSARETQVKRYSGTVLVQSIQPQKQPLELNQTAAIASIKTDKSPVWINKLSRPGLGKIPNELLQLIKELPFTALPGVTPIATTSAVVPLFSRMSDSDSTMLAPIEALVALVNDSQWHQARLLADELKYELEGLPRFDLYHGLLLVNEQQYDEAIFSFERVLAFSPQLHRARLELGRAYFQTGNYERARNALNQVLDADPPANVRRSVNILLARVEQAERRSLNQTYFGGTVLSGWDSNGNSGSNLNDALDPNLLGLTDLADGSEPIESAFVQWSVSTGLMTPTSQTAANQLFVDFTHKNYIEPQLFDTSSLTVGTQLNGQSEHWRTRLPLSIQWSWVDGQSWQGTIDGTISHQYLVWGPLWAGVKLGTQLSVAFNSANVSTVKDLAGIALDAQERGRVHKFSSLYLQTLQAGQDDEHIEWQGFANRYQLNWSLPWNIDSSFAIEHQWRRYKSEDLFFTINDVATERKRRQDQVINMEIQGSWSPTDWFQTRTLLGWEWVNSNINVYGRDRITVSQAISVQF